MLDTGRTSAGRVGGIPRLDASMDAALLLAALAVAAGDRVDLIAADRRVRARVVGAGRGDVLAAFTNELALLEADLIEPDIGLMISTVLGVARQRCLVVLLTDLNPAAIELGLLPRVRLLSSRHQVLLAAVVRPAGRRRWPPAVATRRRCTTPPRRSRPRPSARTWRRCCAGAASRSWTRRLTGCRRRWPTPT